MDSLLNDLRYAARTLAKQRGFAFVAVLTLALGIGANTAIFGALRAVFLRPLPYPASERLVHVWATWAGGAGNFSYPDYVAMLEQNRSFDALAAYEPWGSVALTGGGAPSVVTPNFVTPSYLEMLGARPVLGRTLRADDNAAPHGAPVVVLSHAFWQRQFGGDAGIVGRALQLNQRPFTVVGVLPADFRDLAAVEGDVSDAWLPAMAAPALLGQAPLTDAYRIYWGLARLKPGVTPEQARADVAATARRMAQERPDTHRGYDLEAQPLTQRVRGAFGGPTLLLTVGAAFILLIGCANVANLLLARLAGRRRELAVRASLGASAQRLARQLLAECLLLATLGGGLGLLLAAWITAALRSWIQANVSPFVNLGLDVWALAVAAGLSLLTAFVFGLAPALEGTRVDLRATLNAGSRGEALGGRSLTRRALVVAEVAFSLVLLVGAGLMLRSFANLRTADLGFRTENLLTFRAALGSGRYADAAARVRFTDAFLESARAVPGVESATLWGPSMLGRATWVVSLLPVERPAESPDAFVMTFRHSVNPGGLSALGMPLLAGRDFDRADTDPAMPVAIVSESVARQFWPGEDPIGRRLRRPNPSLPPITVVGVARDARHRQRYDLADIAEGFGPTGLGPQRDIYLPYAQRPNNDVTFGVRVRGDLQAAAAGLRAALAALDPDLPLGDLRLLDERLAAQDLAPGALTALLGAYALLALLLATLGLYGVVSHAVGRRTREIGVRVALGAQRGDLMRMVFGQGLGLATAGVALGLVAAAGLTGLMRALLFDVAPIDPLTFAGVPLVLLSATILAVGVPARRATRVDPLVALRDE